MSVTSRGKTRADCISEARRGDARRRDVRRSKELQATDGVEGHEDPLRRERRGGGFTPQKAIILVSCVADCLRTDPRSCRFLS